MNRASIAPNGREPNPLTEAGQQGDATRCGVSGRNLTFDSGRQGRREIHTPE